MKKKISLSLIVPVFNEEETVKATVDGIKREISKEDVERHEIIVVNDGSTDRSGEIIDSVDGIIKRHHPINKGYGASLKTGIRASKYEWILIIDADGTYPIKEIPRLISETEGYDMVVGSRTGKRVYVPFMRKSSKFILQKVTEILTKMDIPDLNSGFRIFKKELALEFWRLFPDGFSFTTTLTIASLTNDYSIKYLPINYFKRKGKSSINPVKDFIRFNVLIFKIILYFAPLKFFIPASAAIFILAVIKGYMDFVFENGIGDLSVILILVSVQIFFFGLLADLVNKRMK